MMDRLPAWRRPLNAAGFALCALSLAFAYYLQFVVGMEPCPLCIFQRVGVFALAFVFLIVALHNPRGWGARVYAALLLLTAAIGAAISLRHLYLQSLPPDQVPACGPGLDYLLDSFPLLDTIRVVLSGSGECAEVDLVLGLSVPAWTLMLYVGLGLAGFLVNWLRPRQ